MTDRSEELAALRDALMRLLMNEFGHWPNFNKGEYSLRNIEALIDDLSQVHGVPALPISAETEELNG